MYSNIKLCLSLEWNDSNIVSISSCAVLLPEIIPKCSSFCVCPVLCLSLKWKYAKSFHTVPMLPCTYHLNEHIPNHMDSPWSCAICLMRLFQNVTCSVLAMHHAWLLNEITPKRIKTVSIEPCALLSNPLYNSHCINVNWFLRLRWNVSTITPKGNLWKAPVFWIPSHPSSNQPSVPSFKTWRYHQCFLVTFVELVLVHCLSH